MANYLRFCGTFSVEVLRFFCLPPCLRTCHGMFEHACSNMACSNMTCSNMFEHDMTCSNMFEHGYRGIHAQYHRYPYGPYGVFKARFLECFGGLESNETSRYFFSHPCDIQTPVYGLKNNIFRRFGPESRSPKTLLTVWTNLFYIERYLMTCSLRLAYQFFHNNTKSVYIMSLKTVNSPKYVKKSKFWARIAM